MFGGHASALVRGEVIHAHHVARAQAGAKKALQEHEERVAVDGPSTSMLVSRPSRLMAPTSERLGGVLRGTLRSIKRTPRGARP